MLINTPFTGLHLGSHNRLRLPLPLVLRRLLRPHDLPPLPARPGQMPETVRRRVGGVREAGALYLYTRESSPFPPHHLPRAKSRSLWFLSGVADGWAVCVLISGKPTPITSYISFSRHRRPTAPTGATPHEPRRPSLSHHPRFHPAHRIRSRGQTHTPPPRDSIPPAFDFFPCFGPLSSFKTKEVDRFCI